MDLSVLSIHINLVGGIFFFSLNRGCWVQGRGSRGGGKGGNCPTFCLNGMDMPVPPPLNFGRSLGISTFLPPPPPKKKIVPAPLVEWVGWPGMLKSTRRRRMTGIQCSICSFISRATLGNPVCPEWPLCYIVTGCNLVCNFICNSPNTHFSEPYIGRNIETYDWLGK